MGRAMLSNSLMKFSLDGWGCVPSLQFTLGQTVVEVMKIMVTFFKGSHACTVTLSSKWQLHSTGAASGGEEIPHVQGHRKPSKTVGARAAVRRYPRPRAKEKPQKDSRRSEFMFRIKPHSSQRCSEGSNKTLGAPIPRDPQTETELCLSVSCRVRVSSGLLQGKGMWVQQTWVWHKPSSRRSPLTPP